MPRLTGTNRACVREAGYSCNQSIGLEDIGAVLSFKPDPRQPRAESIFLECGGHPEKEEEEEQEEPMTRVLALISETIRHAGMKLGGPGERRSWQQKISEFRNRIQPPVTQPSF